MTSGSILTSSFTLNVLSIFSSIASRPAPRLSSCVSKYMIGALAAQDLRSGAGIATKGSRGGGWGTRPRIRRTMRGPPASRACESIVAS